MYWFAPKLMMRPTIQPSTTPKTPPKKPITDASMRKMRRTSPSLPPIAFMIPISLHRDTGGIRELGDLPELHLHRDANYRVNLTYVFELCELRQRRVVQRPRRSL